MNSLEASGSKPLAWVTGVRGFLGRHVARSLSDSGWRVAGVGRGSWTDSAGWGVDHWLEGDVNNSTLISLLELAGPPSIVCHAAGPGTVGESFESPDSTFNESVLTLWATLETVRLHAPQAVVIFPSSCAVYGETLAGASDEDAPLRPSSPYASFKVIGEELCRSAATNFGIRCGIIRLFSLYGPELRKQLIWELFDRARSGQQDIRLGGTGGETRDFFHVYDAVALISRMIEVLIESESPLPLICNGGTGTAISIARVAEIVREELPIDVGISFEGKERIGDPAHYKAGLNGQSLLGVTPSWRPEDGIRAYCRWILEETWD